MDRQSLPMLHGLALALGLLMVTGVMAAPAFAEEHWDRDHGRGQEHHRRGDRDRDRGVYAPPSYDDGFYSHALPTAVDPQPDLHGNIPLDIH